MSSNWKTLFRITVVSASAKAFVGIPANRCSRCKMKVEISCRASGVRMFVYMLVASEMKSRAPGGRLSGRRRSTRSLELRR